MDHRLRWAVAPTDRRAKVAVLLGALPLGVAVAALVVSAGAGVVPGILTGLAATGLVLAAAAWLLAPSVPEAAFGRAERVRAAEKTLELARSEDAPRRVNVLLPIIDLPHFFGGYLGLFNLARRLSDHGRRVRLVTVDPQPRLPSGWRDRLERYEGLAGAFERIEVAFAGDGGPLEVSPRDAFVAASAWTAPVAHRAARALGNERFVLVVQDDDALTHPNGSMAAVVRAAYELPHYAAFSTAALRDYFRRRGLGVFAESEAAGERDSVVFQSAITPVGPVDADEIAQRSPGLLFYARPEDHAARNMFELGLVAVERAITEGVFGGRWRFAGIGSVKPAAPIRLPGGEQLDLLPRTDQARYARTLREFTVGLALMDTPHPSLVPIEMAGAGLAVVTSTYENKDAATLTAISPNLVPARPTVADVTAGLREAVARAADAPARAQGAAVDWPTSWDDVFDDELLARVGAWLDGG